MSGDFSEVYGIGECDVRGCWRRVVGKSSGRGWRDIVCLRGWIGGGFCFECVIIVELGVMIYVNLCFNRMVLVLMANGGDNIEVYSVVMVILKFLKDL